MENFKRGTTSGTSSVLVVAVLAGATVVGSWAAAFRPRIEIVDGNLIVVNPLRSHSVSLAAISNVYPGYSGIRIAVRQGTQPLIITAWAVQKSNWSREARNDNRRADLVVDTIRRSAAKII